MPFNSDSLLTDSRHEFCVAMKAARERKGVTLATIAAETKIPTSVFAAFERNDLRCWPTGLYRRAFFRDYVRMLDVPVTEACAEFARLFVDAESGGTATKTPTVQKAAADAPVASAGDLRLMFDAAWHGPRPAIRWRLLAALLDAISIGVGSLALAWTTSTTLAVAAAIVALAYFSFATSWVGVSPAQWAIAHRHSIVGALTRLSSAINAARPRHSGTNISDSSAGDGNEQPQRAPWTSDARRVGAAHTPHLRFRIKTSH